MLSENDVFIKGMKTGTGRLKMRVVSPVSVGQFCI